MTDMTGREPRYTYKDLLQVSNSNSGIDTTVRNVEDGEGTTCPLQLSSTVVRVTAAPSHDDDVVNKAALDAAVAGAGGGFENDLLFVRDEKTSGTHGGDAVNGSWLTRTLNTVKHNGLESSSLASNQVTLPAGTYYAEARVPAYGVQAHVARLRDVTNGTTLIEGTSAIAGAGAQTDSLIRGRFTLAGQANVEIQHQVFMNTPGFGLGFGHSFGNNVFSELRIWKVG